MGKARNRERDRNGREERRGRERGKREVEGGGQGRSKDKRGGERRAEQPAQTVPQSESVLSAPACQSPQSPKNLQGHLVQHTRHFKGSRYWVVYMWFTRETELIR